jgi:putative ATP-dependent endonuclease of OLD family
MKIKKLEIVNYRTIEKVTIDFEDYYTAMCGKNNSGKSNIIRTLLNIFSRTRFDERFNYNSDYPVWKTNKSSKEQMSISASIFLSKDSDVGLIKFLNVFGTERTDGIQQIDLVEDTNLDIKLGFASKSKDLKTEIKINGVTVEDKYKVSEIIRKINTSQVLIYHNSTQTTSRLRNTNHGHIENISATTKSSIESKIKSIQKELSKVIDKHKKELQELLGRLEEKYEVGLSLDSIDMDLDDISYEINLGEKNFALPLDRWGSGTRNRTLILTSIFNAKKQIDVDDEANKITPIILIEEPESFLHPSAQAEFGRILQDISQEMKIQVITTTHSPYLLSHLNPTSNILVKRKITRNSNRETYIEVPDERKWKEPFELALGMIGPEFESLKQAFFSTEKEILFVEGDIDKEYFEMLKEAAHGDERLKFSGEVYSYDGFGFLNNAILLKFIRNRFTKVVITLDLDTYDQVQSNLERVGFIKDKDYFVVGLDQPGKRNIEGLLPEKVINAVNAQSSNLVQALFSNNKEEVKSAKGTLKKKYLAEFQKDSKPTKEYFGEFYKLVKRINKELVKA